MKSVLTFLIIFFSLIFFVLDRAHAADAPPGHNIGVFGDSLGDGVWSGLYNTEKKHPADKLFRHAKVGSGLTRPDFPTWIKEFAGELDTDKTDVAIVMFGANDEQGIRDENHKGYVFKSDGWKRTYNARMDAMFAEFEKRKIAVIWIGLPIMRTQEINEGAAYLNDLFATEVKNHNAIFVPTIDDFKGPNGEFNLHYTDKQGKQHLLRAEDGVHFTGYGYELIAEKAYAAIPVASAATPATTTPAPAVPADTSTGTTPVAPPSPPVSPTPPAAPENPTP